MTQDKIQIIVNTDGSIDATEPFALHVRDVVEAALSRYSEHITRVEIHLSDENAHKKGLNDKRCMLEARLKGRQPTVVTHEADTTNMAIDGAVDKLQRSIRKSLERMRDLREPLN